MKHARWMVVPVVAAALSAGVVPREAAAVDLIADLGGPAGFGTHFLAENDDSSSGEIDISRGFPGGLRYFAGTYRSIFVNNNGNITFRGAVGQFTPTPFPIADQPMIAPFWADVDTRGGGRPGRNGVWWDVRPGQVVITWHNVGYFGSHVDRLNSFQIVLRGGSEMDEGQFEVEFRYARCEWTTGDASGGSGGRGGTPAQAGFDAGNRRDSRVLPGSRTAAVLRLCRTSNVSEPGVWRFLITNGRPMRSPARE
ncbi:MAG: nidogen-like domain-containing protein [Deltaproteobacteria bacterium]|nr:nidogen-like domain-containing protein [Myxococcales bacterium]MDP3221009.1 nidogen-like domain-containing protein [Deltaproteobacteria bacterium]